MNYCPVNFCHKWADRLKYIWAYCACKYMELSLLGTKSKVVINFVGQLLHRGNKSFHLNSIHNQFKIIIKIRYLIIYFMLILLFKTHLYIYTGSPPIYMSPCLLVYTGPPFNLHCLFIYTSTQVWPSTQVPPSIYMSPRLRVYASTQVPLPSTCLLVSPSTRLRVYTGPPSIYLSPCLHVYPSTQVPPSI